MTDQPTALVTGASSGIGAATARALAAQGYRVFCAARRYGRVHDLAAQIGGAVGQVVGAVPHAARAIAGQDARWIAAWCLVLGPILVLVADVTGRLVLRPSELPVGVVTALIGVPVLIVLVRRTRAVPA